MSDAVVSLIRTWVPIGVGAVLTFLATRLGVVVDEETSTGLVVGATGVVSAAYYAAVRWAERRWPWLGALLGKRSEPMYARKSQPLPETGL